ncbi:MAG: GNAT family N-acetyltransferase [Planctomycetota bacterium]
MSTRVLVDLDLARRLERTEGKSCAGIVRSLARLHPDRASTVFEIAGCLAMFDGADSPMTQSFGLGVFDPVADSDLDAIEAFYHERSSPADHEICPLSGVELTQRLVSRGYTPTEMSNVLFRPISAEDGEATPNPALSVRRTGADEVDLWAKTAARGWSDFGEFLDILREVAEANARVDEAHAFLVERDAEAIAAGGLFIADGTALFAGASTVPEARRQGAQRVLFERRLAAAYDAGCDLAVMIAEPGSSSQRNAQRNGFRIAYSRTKWRLEPR